MRAGAFRNKKNWFFLMLFIPEVVFGAEFKKWFFNKASPAEKIFEQAEEEFQGGRFSEAQKHYLVIIEKYPYSSLAKKAQFRIAQCYLELGMDEEAVEEFRLYIKNNAEDPDLVKAFEEVERIKEELFRMELSYREDELQRLKAELARMRRSGYLRAGVKEDEIYLEINLDANELYIKMGTQILYSFPVVTGKGPTRLPATGRIRNFDTPRGVFEIIAKEKNPVWYKPDWYWLEKGKPVPKNLTLEERAVPGYLGKYRLHLGGGYSIHGTKGGIINPGKYSHGCIRMNEKDLEKVWDMTEVGTKVIIY